MLHLQVLEFNLQIMKSKFKGTQARIPIMKK